MPEVREARLSESAQVGRVCAAAFWDDVLFGDLIHPHRHDFPADNDLYWSRRFQVNWWDYTHRFVVTTATGADGREAVAGVAQWERLGEGGRKKMQCWRFDPSNLAKPLASFATQLAARAWPNRAADPATEDIIERSYPFLDHVWTGPQRAEGWYLASLAVDPAHQGRGHGRALVQWGLDRAADERVCASVISAAGKERFYRRCGFDREAGRSGEGEGNPLADVPGGVIFFRDAQGEDGRKG